MVDQLLVPAEPQRSSKMETCMKSVTVALAVAVFCGCTNKPVVKTEETAKAHNASKVLGTPVDQPATTLDEDAILRIAKQAVEENDTWAESAEYTVAKDGSEWNVIVWRLPKVPGGHRNITINSSGVVVEYGRGH